MSKRHRKPAPYKPAVEGATARDKGVVVSIQRFRWKEAHAGPSERALRMLRFVWMRQPFYWKDRERLHAGVLGSCLRGGLMERGRDELKITTAGAWALDVDRKGA